MESPTLYVDAGGCTSIAYPTIYLTNMEIGTACGSKCCSEAADAMASNEDSVRQETLRRRNQRDRLKERRKLLKNGMQEGL